jgi:hypothetical protein
MAYTMAILIIIIGIIYGYMKPGKEDRSAILKKGVVIGIILGAITIVLGLLGGGGFLLFGSVVGVAIFIEVIILAVLFVIGTYIGDMLERK